jgi:hypothetical protein
LHIHQENKAILKWLSKKNTNHEEIDRSWNPSNKSYSVDDKKRKTVNYEVKTQSSNWTKWNMLYIPCFTSLFTNTRMKGHNPLFYIPLYKYYYPIKKFRPPLLWGPMPWHMHERRLCRRYRFACLHNIIKNPNSIMFFNIQR